MYLNLNLIKEKIYYKKLVQTLKRKGKSLSKFEVKIVYRTQRARKYCRKNCNPHQSVFLFAQRKWAKVSWKLSFFIYLFLLIQKVNIAYNFNWLIFIDYTIQLSTTEFNTFNHSWKILIGLNFKVQYTIVLKTISNHDNIKLPFKELYFISSVCCYLCIL